MAHVIVTEDSTRADLAEAITHLREKQLACVIPSTAAEVGDVIDRLLEDWLSKTE